MNHRGSVAISVTYLTLYLEMSINGFHYVHLKLITVN